MVARDPFCVLPLIDRRHNINTGMFLASLSVAELLLLLVYLPLEFTKDILTQEVEGGAVCKLKEFVKMLTALASVINLAAVSFERSDEKKSNFDLTPKCLYFIIDDSFL